MAIGFINYRGGGSYDPAAAAQEFANQQAINVGFKSAADQESNRMMRNQLEMKAAQLGLTNEQAYSLVQGPLTNTAALQDAWNRLGTLKPAQPAFKDIVPPPPLVPQTSYTDKISELEKQVTETEQTVPTIEKPSAVEATIKNLEDQIKTLTDKISIGSAAEIEKATTTTMPQIDPELVAARAAIEDLRNQMTIQSEAFQGQTAAQKLDAERQQQVMMQAMAAQQAMQEQQAAAQYYMYQQQQQAQLEAAKVAEQRQLEAQAMSQRQAEMYQSNITNLQSRLDQEAANYRSQLQGLAESQRAFQINQARASLAPEFQISSTPNQQVGGTQAFKIRRPNTSTPAMLGIGSSALNAPTLNVLNI